MISATTDESTPSRPEFAEGDRAKIIWSIRAAARRERSRDRDTRLLLDPTLSLWKPFEGYLTPGDLVALVIENAAQLNPLAMRPLIAPPSATDGDAFILEALDDSALLRASSANFLEAAAVAFGREPLASARRSAFEAIRLQDQRILELPSTAGRVTSAVAEAGAPLETYVAYVAADDTDRFLIGLTMLEFDRNAAPLVIDVANLEAGNSSNLGTFTRAATLGGEEHIIGLLPPGTVARVVTL